MADEQAPILVGVPATSNSPAELRAQVGEIMRDPMWGRDPALTEKVDALYRAHYGEGKVPIGPGITVEGKPGEPSPSDAPADILPPGSLPPWAEEQQRKLGDQWEAAVEKLGHVTEKLFGDDEAKQEAFINQLRAAGWTDEQIFNAAQNYGD